MTTKLSRRELKTARLACDELRSTREIALVCGVPEAIIHRRLSSVYSKLGIDSRDQLAGRFTKTGDQS